MPPHRIILVYATSTGMAFSKTTAKRSNGSDSLPNRGILWRKATSAPVTLTGKVFRKTSRRLPDGTAGPPNRGTPGLRLTSACAIRPGRALAARQPRRRGEAVSPPQERYRALIAAQAREASERLKEGRRSGRGPQPREAHAARFAWPLAADSANTAVRQATRKRRRRNAATPTPSRAKTMPVGLGTATTMNVG